MEAELPPHTNEKGNRDHYRSLINASAQEAIEAAIQIDRLSIPPLIQGMRLFLVGLLLTSVGPSQ